ncbi:MAG: hypothetical protein JST68_30220 [Bacteroidetes bacterium]|nr:hypothetical protein [Bacteroidota bacterium]
MNIDLNLVVFTIRKVVYEKSPVVYVVHGIDDEWQFLSNAPASLSDLMIVSLRQILEIDPSLSEILSIPQGMEAVRSKIGDSWNIGACSQTE